MTVDEAPRREIERLREALAWALKNGANWAGQGLIDFGCGCCSRPIEPPEHLSDLFTPPPAT